MTSFDESSFRCPRCQQTVHEAYYGPCGQCREDLTTIFAGEAHGVDTAAYEPKVNVTPNAVALKD